MITREEEKKKKRNCTQRNQKRKETASVTWPHCTKIGMPKYGENKKKWKSFLPGNIPANICHRQCLVCEGVCVLYSMCHQRVWLCTRFWMLRNTYSCLCESVCICVQTQQKCVCLFDSVWMSAGVCIHSHTHSTYVFMYIQCLLLLISCTFFVCARERS